MPTQTAKGKFVPDSRTAAQLTSANPVLLADEMVFERDTGRRKVGDGITPWTALPYVPADNTGAVDATKLPLSGGTMTGGIQGASLRGTNISAVTSNTALYVPPNIDSSSTAQGVISWRAGNGDGFAISNINNAPESRIISATKANIDANANVVNADVSLSAANGFVINRGSAPKLTNGRSIKVKAPYETNAVVFNGEGNIELTPMAKRIYLNCGSTSGEKWAKIATINATSASEINQSLNLNGTITRGTPANTHLLIDIIMSSRDGFFVTGSISATSMVYDKFLQVYKETDGSYSVWMELASYAGCDLVAKWYGGAWGSIIESPVVTETAPTGTKVWESRVNTCGGADNIPYLFEKAAQNYLLETNATYTSGAVKWTNRVMWIPVDPAICLSTSEHYISVYCPAEGTVVAGLGGTQSVTVGANGLPMAAWDALIFRHDVTKPPSTPSAPSGTLYVYNRASAVKGVLQPNDLTVCHLNASSQAWFGSVCVPSGYTVSGVTAEQKLPLAGGTMTGEIRYNMFGYTSTPIKLLPAGVNGANNVNGQDLIINTGGGTIIGSGESATNMYALSTSPITAATDEEDMMVSSDTNIHFVSNCQTVANNKRITLNPAGTLVNALNNNMLEHNGNGMWIDGLKGTIATIKLSGAASQMKPFVSFPSTNGRFCMAGYQGALHIVYTSQATIDAGTNTAEKSVTINEAGTVTAPSFSGALSGNSATATALQTARTINGVLFNGSGNIIVPGVYNAVGSSTVSGEFSYTLTAATTYTAGQDIQIATVTFPVALPTGKTYRVIMSAKNVNAAKANPYVYTAATNTGFGARAIAVFAMTLSVGAVFTYTYIATAV